MRDDRAVHSSPAERVTRLVLGVALPACWVAAAALPFVLAWARLPDSVATHWSAGGAPNGAMPRGAAAVLLIGLGGLAAAGSWIAVHRRQPSQVGTCAFLGVMFGALAISIVRANVDVATWQEARSVSLLAVAGLCGIAGAASVLASRVARPLATAASSRPTAAPPSLGLGATERAMWSGTTRNRGLTVLALALAAAAIGISRIASPWSALGCGVAALAVATFSEVHVAIDERAVVVAFGMWRFPRMTIRLDRIREARMIQVVPLERGGWGYRGSLRARGKAAVIVRGGEGLELIVDGGKSFVVTIDDALAAAGLVNDLIARRAP